MIYCLSQDAFKSEKDIINSYAWTTGANLDCPKQTGME